MKKKIQLYGPDVIVTAVYFGRFGRDEGFPALVGGENGDGEEKSNRPCALCFQ